MNFNGRNFGKIDLLNKSPFIQHWDDAGVNPPPPGFDVRITNSADNRITNDGDIRITNTDT